MNREASSQEKGLAGRIGSAKFSWKRSKQCLQLHRTGGWEDQMSVLTTNILCYLVCTVIGFRSPEVNLWHCTPQKTPSWKIFDRICCSVTKRRAGIEQILQKCLSSACRGHFSVQLTALGVFLCSFVYWQRLHRLLTPFPHISPFWAGHRDRGPLNPAWMRLS